MSYTPPPPPPPGQGGYGYAAPQTNQKAMWAMILGILALVCCGIFTGIPALILGNSAKNEIAASGGAQTGEGMAKAGVILGWISIAWSVIAVIIIVSTGVLTSTTTTSP
jgi:Domain of unknown function (DUF4190)